MIFIYSNKKGFAYVVAVAILGLLAFMGLFLMQTSSIEYSQTSISVYRTMGRQLAEAAAEEAFVMLEERFKDKSSTGFFQQLMWQASTSGSLKSGGSTGRNPSKLDDFTDLNRKVTQALALKDYHISRAGFTIEKILPTIKDLRPIFNGAADADSNYYRPTDREKPFDTELSKSWYCTLQIDVTVTLDKTHKTTINYQMSKDIKLLNLAPIARNYTFFSILGIPISGNDQADIQSILRSAMNNPSPDAGRLILWNVPFQSRVYLHGPAVIDLENPNIINDIDDHIGAYNTLGEDKLGQGDSNSFQYDDTLYGFSYFPDVKRGIFPSKNFIGIFTSFGTHSNTKNDSESFKNKYALIEKDTVVGGFLPDPNSSFLNNLGSTIKDGLTDKYFTGTNFKQCFLPAGPYCRTPWKYVAPTPRSNGPHHINNIKDLPETQNFPEDEPTMQLEHAWREDDETCAENSKILAYVNSITYNRMTNRVSEHNTSTIEFGLNYYNNPDPEGFLAKLGSSLGSAIGGIWNFATLPFQTVGHLATLGWHKFFPPKDAHIDSEEVNTFPNLLPTNFMFNYQGAITRHLPNEDAIPKDSNGRWILNGVYLLDSLKIEAPITYIGTGTLMVNTYTEDEPLTIKGDVVAARDSSERKLGHLNIFYHPYNGGTSEAEKRMLVIDGSNGGVTIEASVYSCYGIKSISPTGSSINNFTELGMNPNLPFDQWPENVIGNVTSISNMIKGNYINYYMNIDKQKNDLWIVHDFDNPCYFEPCNGGGVLATQLFLDQDENKRKTFEYGVHEFFMSPKIQHVGIRGAL